MLPNAVRDLKSARRRAGLPLALSLLTLGFAVTASSAAAPNYSRLVLGTLGGNSSAAASLNASGLVVGSAQQANGDDAPFLFKDVNGNNAFDAGEMTNLTPGEKGIATDINAFGQVSGTTETPMASRAFIWTPAESNGRIGNWVYLTPEEVDSGANAINSFGQVVGTMLSQNGRVAFLWTPSALNNNGADGGTLVELPGFGGAYAEALDINDQGQVVGIAMDENFKIRPFLWTPDNANGTTGSVVELNGIPAGTNVGATAINNAGVVVGYVENNNQPTAYLWTPSTANGTTGTFSDLGRPVPTGLSNAFSINSNNEVVGVATHSNGQVLGVFRDSSGYTYLNNKISPTDVGFFFAAKILDDRRITGIGAVLVNGTVRSRAVVLTPQGATGVNGRITFEPDAPTGTVNAGQQVSIPVLIKNLGPSTATNFRVRFTLTNMNGVSMNVGGNVLGVSGQQFSLNYSTFSVDHEEVITVIATVPGNATGTASITAVLSADQTDSEPGNNTITRQFQVAGAPTKPAAPANAKATASSPFAIVLTWADRSSNETEFEIQRRVTTGNFGNFAPLTTVGPNITTYTDTVSPRSRFQYRVRAKNSAGTSAWVESNSARTPSATPSDITVTGGPVDFLDVKVGTFKVKTITLKNNSTTNTVIAIFDIEAPFEVRDDAPSVHLAPGESRQVDLFFRPTSAGTNGAAKLFESKLVIRQSERANVEVALKGRAVTKQGQITFGLVVPALPKGEPTFPARILWTKDSNGNPLKKSDGPFPGGIEVKNTGDAPVKVRVTAPAGVNAAYFKLLLKPEDREFTLKPGKSKGLVLAYQPKALGTHVASISVTDLNIGQKYDVILGGRVETN